MSSSQTHFGFRRVPESEKAGHVRQVFDSVAERYDLMNDVMSMGLHRVWKAWTVAQAHLREGHQVLDVASGTGDLAMAMAPKVGRTGRVVMTDINAQMLGRGRDRLLDSGHRLPAMVCDAEALPFAESSFDRVTLAFGLRNMTHKDRALKEILRVLKPTGKLLVLEFSHVAKPLEKLYDFYSFKLLPWFGERLANDRQSYQYLAESIRMHPTAGELAQQMKDSGFGVVRYSLHTAGVVALHQAVKV